MAIRREPVPVAAFKVATTDIGETEFGYLQRLAFARVVPLRTIAAETARD
jgi:hypothetical protein